MKVFRTYTDLDDIYSDGMERVAEKIEVRCSMEVYAAVVAA